MDAIENLSRCLAHMRATVAAVPADEWDTVTNCAPWTADVLVGHMVASQLLWLGSIDGEQRVDVGQVMKPEAIDGDRLARIARHTWNTSALLAIALFWLGFGVVAVGWGAEAGIVFGGGASNSYVRACARIW